VADLILASASPRRRELLERVGFVVEVLPADVDEKVLDNETVSAYVERVARAKADTVARLRPESIVLAADTTVSVDGRVMGKAASEREAEEMLASLSGRQHSVTTVVVAGARDKLQHFSETTIVEFRELATEEVKDYLRSGEWRGKAGAYALQGIAAAFIPRVQGCFTNVIGLPLAGSVRLLASLGVKPSYASGRPAE
jgi:septum formation protein